MKDWIIQKRSSGDFSYSLLAQKSGFESRSYLRLIVTNKRNITNNSLAKTIYGLGLEGNEAQGFQNLVKANQSATIEDRLQYWNQFLKHRPQTMHVQVLRNCFTYLSQFINPVVKTLLSQSETANWSPERISRFLNVTPGKITEALETLTNLGFLRKNELGERKVKINYYRAFPDLPATEIWALSLHSGLTLKRANASTKADVSIAISY